MVTEDDVDKDEAALGEKRKKQLQPLQLPPKSHITKTTPIASDSKHLHGDETNGVTH